MTRRNYSLALLFLGCTFFSYSQYQYSLEVESFNGKHPKEVLDDITEHLDNYNRHITNDVITFESKVPITEEKIIQIVEISGYTVKTFKPIGIKKEESSKEILDK